MGHPLSRVHRTLALAISAALLLAGCTTDRYFMVKKNDVETIQTAVKSQQTTLVTMEENAATRHEQLLEHDKNSTQSILKAIDSKVEKPRCPEPEPATECQTDNDNGRADRLKGMMVVGQLEKFHLAGPGLVFNARIDSGAETSSIYGRNIQEFERDGSNWVKFEVPVPGSEENDWAIMEKKIARTVRIIQSSSNESERRFVVTLQFAIGDHQQLAEFTLADRENLTYDVLVGRNILRDVMLIDVGEEFATKLAKPYRQNDENGDRE